MPPTNIFGQRREPLVNFNWADVADATGYISYNLWKSATLRHLIPSSIASGHNLDATEVTPDTPTTSTSFVKLIDLDYDLTALQLPRTLRGSALLKLSFHLVIAAADAPCEAYLIMKLRKGDDTEIANVQSETLTGDTQDTFTQQTNLIMVIPRTLIKKGEVIRITCEGWAKVTTPATANVVAPIQPTVGNSIITLPYRMDI